MGKFITVDEEGILAFGVWAHLDSHVRAYIIELILKTAYQIVTERFNTVKESASNESSHQQNSASSHE